MGYLGHEKGDCIQIFDAIEATATSNALDLHDFNSLMLSANIQDATKNWTIKLVGAIQESDDFLDVYDDRGANQLSKQTNASKCFVFKGIPRFVKVVATTEEESGSKLTLNAQGINL